MGTSSLKCKMSHKKYGHLPIKEAKAEPWERLCVDVIGPYTIKCKGSEPLPLWCITMIDPDTGWIEIIELTNKESITTANVVEQTWLTQYPIGTELMAEFSEMIEKDYGIKKGNHSQKSTSKCKHHTNIFKRQLG
jgi:hypothetical protein